MRYLINKLVSFIAWFSSNLFPVRASETDSGRLIYEDGTVYIGEHKDGFPEGKGKFIMPNGDEAEGSFRKGLPHGPCLIKYASGGSFTGQMKGWSSYNRNSMTKDDSRITALVEIGTMVFPDGAMYVGKFKNGRFHGKGEMKEANGECWIGRFKKGKLHGFGKLALPDGAVYIGNFKNGLFQGKGEMKEANGERWVGKFKFGKPHGRVTVFYHQGWKFQGRFENGIAVGKAKMTSPEGVTEVVDSNDETPPAPSPSFKKKKESGGKSGTVT